MADVQKAIEVIFSGKDDGMTGTIAKIGGGLDDLSGNLQSVTQPLSDIGMKVLGLEAALGALALGGLALSVAKAGEFNDSFGEISTLIDAPAEKVDQFRQDIIKYGEDSKFAFDKINGAVYQAISATGDWEGSLGLLEEAEKLAIGGVTDLESSTRLLATTMNAYGETSMVNAADYSDVFFQTVRDGVTTIPELESTIANVSAIASSAGIPFETLGASISAMTGYGVGTAETMTQLKQAIVGLIAPTDATKAAAKELGVDLGKSAIESQGFETVLRNIYDAANGDLEVIKKIIPSIEGANAVMILGEDAAGKFATALDNQANNAGAAEAAYKKMSENFGLINQQMANNFDSLLINVGDKLVGSYADMSGGLIGIFQALTETVESGAFDPIFAKIQELSGKVTDFLLSVAENIPEAFSQVDFEGLLGSIDSLFEAGTGMFQSFFGDIDLTTVDGLAAAIQKIVDSIASFTEVTAGIIEGLTPFVEFAGTMLDKFNSLDETTREWIGQILGLAMGLTPVLGALGAFGLAIEGGALAMGGLSKAIGFADVGQTLRGALGGLTPLLSTAVGLWAAWETGTAIGTALYEKSDLVRGVADEVANWVGQMVTGIDTEEALNDLLSAGTELTQEQIDAWKERTQALEATPSKVETEVALLESFEGASQEVLNTIVDMVNKGNTSNEIITALKAQYGDQFTQETFDFVRAQEDIQKVLDIKLAEGLGIDPAILDIFSGTQEQFQVAIDAGINLADEHKKILDYIIMASDDPNMSAAAIKAAIEAEYKDTATADLINWVQVDQEIAKWVGVEAELTDPDGVVDFIKNTDEFQFISTELGITIGDQASQELLDFIVARIGAGETDPVKILSQLETEFADSISEEQINFLQSTDAINKLLGIGLQNADGIKPKIDAAVGADDAGIISYPASIDLSGESALTAAEQIKMDIYNSFNEAGLTIDLPGLDDILEKAQNAANDVRSAMGGTFEGIGGEMQYWFDEATGSWVTNWTNTAGPVKDAVVQPVKDATVDIEAAALEKKETIEAALKYRAEVKIEEYQTQTEQMKIKADLIAESLKFKAEVDIAELETIQATVDSISVGLETSASVISDALGSLGDIGSQFGGLSPQLKAATQAIESETENRKKLTDSLVAINDAQAAYLEAKTDALKSGDGLIKIEMEGVYPELEMIMWKIMERVQIRATENLDDFLLGVG